MITHYFGWGSRIRTYESSGQSRMPYRLATPQFKCTLYYIIIENLFQEKMIQNDQANMYVATSTLGEYSASIGTAICGYYNLIESSVD